MGIEKRKFARVRADFGVEYKIKDSDAPSVKAVSVNISEGGIMMKLSERLAPDTLIDLKIILPPPSGTVKTLARIVYTLENYWDEYPPYRCGIQFLGLKEEDREQLREYVSQEIAKLDWKHWL